MLCQKCQKRPASVHITQIINNQKREVYLCEQCAKQQNKVNLSNAMNFSPMLSISDFLTEFLGKGLTGYQVQPIEPSNMPVCKTCGMTYEQFTKHGKFGCADCYKTFDKVLDPILKRIHGNIKHEGKYPERAGGDIKLKRNIEKLKAEINEAVKLEEYEQAAKIRDEIRQLESELKEGKDK